MLSNLYPLIFFPQLFGWKPGNYTLEVIGQGGINVRNTTSLIFEHKSNSVFIQTDRPVYKPGQLGNA